MHGPKDGQARRCVSLRSSPRQLANPFANRTIRRPSLLALPTTRSHSHYLIRTVLSRHVRLSLAPPSSPSLVAATPRLRYPRPLSRYLEMLYTPRHAGATEALFHHHVEPPSSAIPGTLAKLLDFAPCARYLTLRASALSPPRQSFAHERSAPHTSRGLRLRNSCKCILPQVLPYQVLYPSIPEHLYNPVFYCLGAIPRTPRHSSLPLLQLTKAPQH